MNSSSSGSGNFALGLLLGAVIGVSVGMLYAPRPGSETREILKDKAEEVKDRASEFMEQVREGASSAKQAAEERLTTEQQQLHKMSS